MAGLEAKPHVNGIFYAVGSIGGRRVRQSLGVRDKGRATELCALLEAKLWKRHSYGEAAVRTFEEAAVSYVEAGGEARYLRPLMVHMKGRILGSIKPEEVRQAARHLGTGKGPATLNRQYIVPARAVINHAADLGWCASLKIRSFPVPKPKRVHVERDWIDAFLEQADADKLPHLAAAMLFMWQTAARVSETARVMPDHLDLANRRVLLERTKTDEWAVVDISVELMVRIANLPIEDGKPVFGYADRFGIRNRMKAVCRRAGIPFVPPHQSGRHSFFSNTLNEGVALSKVMQGGRASTARLVLETYTHSMQAGREIADHFDQNRAKPSRRARQASDTKGRK